MKLLLEIRDEDFGLSTKKTEMKIREAARAIALKDNKIALLFVSKDGRYHKLPGGGIEQGESIEEALFREMREETGCKIKITSELGKIVEHRTHFGVLQTSYCYVAKVMEEGTPDFDEGEIAAGYKLEWASLEDAINILKKERHETYDGKFIGRRDIMFLEEAKKIIGR